MNRRLALLLLAVVAVKLVFLAIDSAPSYRFDDSGTYLATAIAKWIPPDRGFVYGLLLRPLCVWTRSLMPAVYLQVALSGLAAWLVAFALVRFFAAEFRLAAGLSLACALEPLQLVSERYMLTEAIGTFVFAVLLVAAFTYLRTSSLSILALIQMLGVFLVSLRVKWLLLAVTLSILLPLFSRRALSVWRTFRRRRDFGRALRFVAIPLIFSVGLSQVMLFGYRLLYGALTDGPPGYTHADGFFLAAELAPVVDPGAFPAPSMRDAVFRDLTYPLADPDLRYAQRLLPGGLDNAIERACGGRAIEANRLAHITAVNALREHAVAAARLAVTTYDEYFDYSKAKANLLFEQRGIAPLPRDVDMMKLVFGADVRQRNISSATKTWELWAIPWYWFLLFLPFIYMLALLAVPKRVLPAHIICAVCAMIFVFNAVVPVELADPRYLTTLAWLAFVLIGSLFSRRVRRTAPTVERPAFQVATDHAA